MKNNKQNHVSQNDKKKKKHNKTKQNQKQMENDVPGWSKTYTI